MTKILVLADDYTGALDTGVQFASYRCKVKVIHQFAQFSSSIDGDTDVLIYDTETRHVSPQEAYDIVYKIARYAFEKKVPCIYKKADSALRGNVGAEIEAIMAAYESQEMIFLPSLPKMNRILKEGILYIEGIPVGESIFAKDPFNPIKKSHIQDILGAQTKVPVQLMKANALPCDDGSPKIYAYDAESMDEIFQITTSLQSADHLNVLAGCAGFAEVLSQFLFSDNSNEKRITNLHPAVVLCGSLNDKSLEQIDYAVKKGFLAYVLSVKELLSEDFFESSQWGFMHQQILSVIQRGDSVILRTEEALDEAEELGILSSRIAERLGEIGKYLASEEIVQNLYIIGGDTLFGFIYTSDIQEVVPMEERNAGVVVSEIVVSGQKKYLISKSGGLGTKEAVYEINYN